MGDRLSRITLVIDVRLKIRRSICCSVSQYFRAVPAILGPGDFKTGTRLKIIVPFHGTFIQPRPISLEMAAPQVPPGVSGSAE